jgi:hypothetical protein
MTDPKYIPSTTHRNLLTKERVEAACKRYNSAEYAAEALGVNSISFRRACHRHGVTINNK